MNKFRHAAIEILSEAKQPMHYKEITRLALEKGILETDGATPDASMNAQIITDMKKKGKASDFIKTAPSTYSLNTNKATIPEKKKIKEKETEQEDEDKIKIEGAFVGKAGEHLVCSELLFRGFNASIMSVDVGMDIIATKDNKLFSIQVKTANINQYNYYNFDVRKVSFEKDHGGNVTYVFVLKGEDQNNYLILPRVIMEQKVHEKAILEINGGKTYRVNIRMRDDNIFLGNKAHEVSYFKNNWSVIK
jgi:hypothetical protein